MTSRRKPRALMSTGELIQADGARRSRVALERDEKTRRDAGLLAHSLNLSDPWAATELRTCDPGCVEHGGAA